MAPHTRNHSPAHAPPSSNGDASTPGATAGDVKLRRAHRKSRNGCRECKRRHVKCDETRPTCVNCATAERHCSYLDSLPAAASARPAVPAKRALATGQSPSSSGSQVAIVAGNTFAAASSPSVTSVVNDYVMRTEADDEVARPANGQFFTLEHMRLLHHIETNMDTLMAADEFLKPLTDMILDAALKAPYLMDILLSLSAQHMADINPACADQYRHQSTQLQTRGLMLFNEAKEVISEETCIPMFLFASTLGNQLLGDTLRSYRHDFNVFLDQFAWYLNLHRGVSAVTGRSWHIIRESGAKGFIEFLDSREPNLANVPEVDILHRMLDQADMGPSSLQACRNAAETLRHSYGIYRTISNQSAHQSASVMSFGVRVNSVFVDVLKQRRPEALVILAYYAVLVHWCRGFWLFADAGQFMIRSISAHLGDYWAEWLAFPNSVVEEHAG
ncbi:hypothetical protein EsH8_II_000391 [Colletotrichum jinshuiense]